MNGMEIKTFLDEKVDQYNRPAFISSDPIAIPHRFEEAQDREIAGFISATLAWGVRKTILLNANRLLEKMPGGPFHFLMNCSEQDLDAFLPFVHRTFNGIDAIYFLKALSRLYREEGGLRESFVKGYHQNKSVYEGLISLRHHFFNLGEPGRTSRHVSNVESGSAAKRLNMFLRWMVRRDQRGVDFGLWSEVDPSSLMIPLDVHSGATARKLGLLTRKQNDWKAVVELTDNLREFDPEDPVKYDYALFGLGVFEKF